MTNKVSRLVKVNLATDSDFSKIMETLTRIGIAVSKTNQQNRLVQSCHILKRKDGFYITHFKELFWLDGQKYSMTEMDIERRNKIALLLEDWGLCTIDPACKKAIMDTPSIYAHFTVVPFAEKAKWNLVKNYTIGKKRVKSDESV